jgi:carboxymethylenebutenolidase
MSTKIDITTKDGRCPAYVFRPDGKGPWPGVLVLMDGIGIRPAMLAVGERLAKSGYFALLPDLFYRAGPYEPMNAKTVFSDPEQRKVLMEKFFSVVSVEKTMSDTHAFLEYMATEPDVKPGGIATTGYCLGARMSLIAAATYPDKIVGAAGYHPGGLVTDKPDSPHLLAPKIKARVYIGGASEDQSFTDEQQKALADALAKAGVKHVVEKYPAKHGWVLSDTPAYDADAAERHWTTLLGFFGETLKSPS